MRRITAIFEERLLAQLRAVMTEAELTEVDYELGPAPYPALQPDGSQGFNMGMSVTLAIRSLVLGDHIMVTGLVQDPFARDEILKINVGELLNALRERRAASGAIANGGGRSEGGLILP